MLQVWRHIDAKDNENDEVVDEQDDEEVFKYTAFCACKMQRMTVVNYLNVKP